MDVESTRILTIVIVTWTIAQVVVGVVLIIVAWRIGLDGSR